MNRNNYDRHYDEADYAMLLCCYVLVGIIEGNMLTFRLKLTVLMFIQEHQYEIDFRETQ